MMRVAPLDPLRQLQAGSFFPHLDAWKIALLIGCFSGSNMSRVAMPRDGITP